MKGETVIPLRVPPIVVTFLIECAISAEPGVNLWPGGWRSESGLAARAWLKSHGLIDPETEQATEKGRNWLAAICMTKEPFASAAKQNSEQGANHVET